MTAALLLPLAIGVSACSIKVPYKSPKVDMPKMPDFKNLLDTCDKKDSEQPAVSTEVTANKIVVQDEIANQDFEMLNCKGGVTSKGTAPVRTLSKFITLSAPANLNEPVAYVSVENFRTCTKNTFDAQDSGIDEKKLTLPDGKVFTIPSTLSQSDRKGEVSLQISDSTISIPMWLNVHDGLNVMKVRYFGACQKFKANKAAGAKDDSYLNCEVPKEIGQKDFVVEVQVQRPQISGTKQIKDCDVPKK